MSIIINEKNRDRIEAQIAEAEGRATARTLSFFELLDTTEDLEARLEGLPLASRKGATATVYDGQCVPNSYGYRAESTYARLERRSSGWAVVSVYRDQTPSKSGGGVRNPVCSLTISKEQGEILLQGILRSRRIELSDAE